MKLHRKNRIILLLFAFFFIFIGCGSEDLTAYHDALEGGLDALIAEDYIEAEGYFEQALAEKPDDVRAEALLAQTNHYENAKQAHMVDDIELALEELNKLIEIKGGSTGLITRAKNFTNELERQAEEATKKEVEDVASKQEKVVKELEELADESETETETETEEVNTEEPEPEEVEIPAAPSYTFDDFKGMYATFSGEPYNSSMQNLMVVTEEELYFGIAFSNYIVYPVVENKINGNTLSIAHIDEESGGTSNPDIFDVTLENDGRARTLVYTYYPVTREQAEAEGLTMPGNF